MYLLENDALAVEVLDPAADRARFGTRYCTGGYIFQVNDRERGPLLSGPTYPESFNTFDGQGIPDAFNLSPLRERGAGDGAALILGIGVCDLEANEVSEFCVWEVDAEKDRVAMRTGHEFGPYAVELVRTVSLAGRTLRSATRLSNRGRRPVPLRWFPHPFYPQPAGDELCRFNIAVDFPENPGYAMDDSGFIRRKGWPWAEGFYQALDHEARGNLVVLQKHPVVGLAATTCSYVPSFFPIWGNRFTFSWEPFLERAVAPGQGYEWWIDYEF